MFYREHGGTTESITMWLKVTELIITIWTKVQSSRQIFVIKFTIKIVGN